MLRFVAETLATWSLVLEREKATLHTLNLLTFDPHRKVFVAEGWVVTSQISKLRDTLALASVRVARSRPPRPPLATTPA